jgi:hypothetical protein
LKSYENELDQIMVLNAKYLNEMRVLGDPDADVIVSQIITKNGLKQLYQAIGSTKGELDPETPAVLREFMLSKPLIPTWFDEQRLKKGQLFFKKYALEIMTLLGALSLPYCYAASPGNKALYFTGKMRKSPGKRLLETAQFIINVLTEEGFSPKGKAMFEVQRTRLVHALVRHYVSAHPSWNMAWGLPVNQEDMAGTNLAFSFIVLKGLDKLKFVITNEEKEDFLYAWRFIGFQLRIHEQLIPQNLAEARGLEEVIKKRHFKFSDEAKLLTAELLQHYKESFPAPAGYFIESQIRYFVGPEVSVLLGLVQHPVRDRIVKGINLFQEKINKRFTNPSSYQIMIRNHNQLKKKYK